MNLPPHCPDFTPFKVFGMFWKRLKEWFASPVINTTSWPKSNATLGGNTCVTLRKFVETMAHQMHPVIKAKGGPIKY